MYQNYALIKELMVTPYWNIEYKMGSMLAKQIISNFRYHSTIGVEDKPTKEMEALVCKASDIKKFYTENAKRLISEPMHRERAKLFQQKLMVGDARSLHYLDELDDDDQVINLIHVEGPITRNSGGCSYGSKDIRDQVLYCADIQNCMGHIFLLDSGGGSAFSANDFEQAVGAAKKAGQPTVGLIDGLCCSACMELASMLDEVYYVHPKDIIGCIGTYYFDFTLKNGDQNSVTKEVFREVYADVSEDKNLAYRKLAEGDESLVKEQVNKYANEFRERVKKKRPNTPEEWLKGKTLEAAETVGIWTNGQSDLQGCIERILALNSPR